MRKRLVRQELAQMRSARVHDYSVLELTLQY